MSAPESQAPVQGQVLIILNDNLDTGELEIGGIQRPLEYSDSSPAHRVGKFLADNMQQIVAAAAAGVQIAPDEEDDQPRIITGERERTIVTETGRRDLLADDK